MLRSQNPGTDLTSCAYQCNRMPMTSAHRSEQSSILIQSSSPLRVLCCAVCIGRPLLKLTGTAVLTIDVRQVAAACSSLPRSLKLGSHKSERHAQHTTQ